MVPKVELRHISLIKPLFIGSIVVVRWRREGDFEGLVKTLVIGLLLAAVSICPTRPRVYGLRIHRAPLIAAPA